MAGQTRKKVKEVMGHPKFTQAVILLLIFLALVAVALRGGNQDAQIYSTATISGINAEITVVRSVTTPGSSLQYTVRLVNQLDHVVPFNVAVYEPMGWKSSYQKYVEVPAGEELEVPVEVTPPLGSKAGEYQFDIIVTTKSEGAWKKIL